MKKFLFFFILTIFSLITYAHALSITPGLIKINFSPGEVHTFSFTISDVMPDVSVKLEVLDETNNDVNETEWLSLDTYELPGPATTRKFTATLSLPQSAEPGTHTIVILATEIPPNRGSAFRTAVALRVPVSIFVPYPGKYVSFNVEAPSVNQGEPLVITVHATSKGTEEIQNLKAFAQISKNEQLIANLESESVSLPSFESHDLVLTYPTSDLETGRYSLKLWLEYDGERTKEKEQEFRIGTMGIDILNWTEELTRGISKFEVSVENTWGDEIPHVYASLDLAGKTYKTPSENLPPWGKRTLSTYIDTTKLPKDSYPAKLTVHYADNEEVSRDIVIKIKGKKAYHNFLIIGSIVVLILLLIILFTVKQLSKNF